MQSQQRLAESVNDIRTRGRRLAQLHLELLRSELKVKGLQLGTAVGVFAGAGLIALYAVGFALATIAVALALVLPLWLSLLIVTLSLVLVITILVLVGRSQIQKLQEVPPDNALAEAQATAALIKAHARGTTAGVRAGVMPGRRPPAAAPGAGREATPGAPASAPRSDTGREEA